MRRDAESAAKTAEKTSKTARTAAEKVARVLESEHKKGVAIAFGVIAYAASHIHELHIVVFGDD